VTVKSSQLQIIILKYSLSIQHHPVKSSKL